MFTEKVLTEFLDLLAAKKSVPGGGGAAALTGSLAAALTSMVCNFTIGKKDYEEGNEQIKQVLAEAEDLRKELTTLIEFDAKVFDELMAVYKMPKDTEEEKNARTNALQEKAKNAAAVPIAVARLSLKTQELALTALQKGNRELASDAILSSILGRAALRSAYYNVVINLKIIKDFAYIESTKQELQELLTQGEQLEKKIIALSDNTFAI